MESEPSKAAKLRAELLSTIDRGRYADALTALDEGSGPSDDVDDTLLRAEVALYLDRFDELPALFDRLRGVDVWLDADDDTGRRARRARALMVEAACFTGDQAEAERLLRPLLTGAVRANDELSELRAIYDAGRIARHRADWDLATDRFERGLEVARRIGNHFYEGRLLYALGHVRYIQNDVEAALPLLQSSMQLLRETEDLRFRATVESFLGCLLSDTGDSKTALALVDSAEATAARLGIVGDMVTARMNAARTRLALGRYEEAERALTDLLAWERRPETTPIELTTLRLLAIVQCVRGRLPDARRSANEALRLAEIGGNDDDRLEARLLVERVRTLAADDNVGGGSLDELVKEADASGTPYVQAEARIYLARALLSIDPTRAKALCDEVRQLPVLASYAWLRRELELVEGDLRALPVRVAPDGRLVMDARLGWPELRAAREATERYWFERALAETGGNISAASRLLGLTRNEGHYLHRLIVKGEPARPSRSKDPDAPPLRRRPPSRRK